MDDVGGEDWEYWLGVVGVEDLDLDGNSHRCNNIALSNLDALPKITAQKLYVKGLDRAGNVIQYDYSFMRLDLPSQLEDIAIRFDI